MLAPPRRWLAPHRPSRPPPAPSTVPPHWLKTSVNMPRCPPSHPIPVTPALCHLVHPRAPTPPPLPPPPPPASRSLLSIAHAATHSHAHPESSPYACVVHWRAQHMAVVTARLSAIPLPSLLSAALTSPRASVALWQVTGAIASNLWSTYQGLKETVRLFARHRSLFVRHRRCVARSYYEGRVDWRGLEPCVVAGWVSAERHRGSATDHAGLRGELRPRC